MAVLDLTTANMRVMSIENYFIYVCAWCCVQPGLLQPWPELHNPEFDIACQGGIVFW